MKLLYNSSDTQRLDCSCIPLQTFKCSRKGIYQNTYNKKIADVAHKHITEAFQSENIENLLSDYFYTRTSPQLCCPVDHKVCIYINKPININNKTPKANAYNAACNNI